jgi:hypothetical protein
LTDELTIYAESPQIFYIWGLGEFCWRSLFEQFFYKPHRKAAAKALLDT